MTDRHRLLDDLLDRVESTRMAVGDQWPYHADPDGGVWATTDDGDWCGGHWVECLRVAGRLSGRRELIEEARERTEWLRPKLERDDMFRGHRFFYSAARLHAETGDDRLRILALAAAYAVRSMAMPVNGAMPIGHQVQVKSTTLASRAIVAVDNVHPNLMLDWWAARQIGDPTFHAGARAHLDLTIRDFVRADGSTVEFIEYDPDTGGIMRAFTLLGAHDQSCWSRGQAWAIAGYLRAWEELGEARYLAVATKLFDYWWDRTDDTGIPAYDFDDPAAPDIPLDTSAAAVVAEQLARTLVVRGADSLARGLTDRLEPMLTGLAAHTTPFGAADPRPAGMMVDGCFNQPKRFANRSELLWTLAYTLMALSYLEDRAVPV